MKYSSKNLPALALALRFTEQAAELLEDFANSHPEDLYRFDVKWRERCVWGWNESVQPITEVQQEVRSVWEGKDDGALRVSLGLGLIYPRRDFDPNYVDTSKTLLQVNWQEGFLWAMPRDLNDYVWLSLLRYSRQLAICANREGGCPTPYFIRKKASQKYCSDACALPAQQAFKRQWWNEHGEAWRQERLKEKSRKKRYGKKQRTRTEVGRG
jgi:hypothetical protein